ncbi:MAG TPA: PilZ domain-containing protein [Humisphaera sp.]
MVAVKQALRSTGHSGPSMRLVGSESDVRQQQQAPVRPVMRLVPADVRRHTRERRVFARKQVSLEVQGTRLDHSLPALRCPGLTLNVRDLSVGGLSALSDLPLLPGERIAVTFPSQGLKLGWDARGTVLRCEPAALGYRVAVEFEQVPSAA